MKCGLKITKHLHKKGELVHLSACKLTDIITAISITIATGNYIAKYRYNILKLILISTSYDKLMHTVI